MHVYVCRCLFTVYIMFQLSDSILFGKKERELLPLPPPPPKDKTRKPPFFRSFSQRFSGYPLDRRYIGVFFVWRFGRYRLNVRWISSGQFLGFASSPARRPERIHLAHVRTTLHLDYNIAFEKVFRSEATLYQ